LTPAQFYRFQGWYNNTTSGPLIQDALPDLTPGEREFLLTGCCESCFDRLFAEVEEDVETDLSE
jgi:hypothetical protein